MRSLILALVLLVASSCAAVVVAGAAAGAGFGYYKYQQNELHQDYRADIETTLAATRSALRSSGLAEARVTEQTSTEARLEAQDVLAIVERYPDGLTRVRVRIGTFQSKDHRRRSLALLDAIGAELEAED